MADFTKTGAQALLALQMVDVSVDPVVVGSAVDVSNFLGGMIAVRFGRLAAAAAGAGVNIRLEASPNSSGGLWVPFATFTTAFAACEAEAVSGTVSSGTKVITVASTTNLAAGDIVFIANGTLGNSEWGRVKSIVAATSITIEENLVNAQTGSTIYDAAEIFPPVAIPEGALRVRAVADGASFTQDFAIEVILATIDAIA